MRFLLYGLLARRRYYKWLARSGIDEALATEITKELALRWAEVIQPTWDGIELAPLVMHKIAGYNVGLHPYVRRLLTAQKAISCEFKGKVPKLVLCPFRTISTEEAFLRDWVRSQEGHFLHLWGECACNERLRHQVEQPFEAPSYQPLEVPLLDVEPRPRLELSFETGCILFMASLSNYLNPMIPVMNRLVRLGHEVVVLLPRAAQGWKNGSHIPDGARRILIEELLTPQINAVFQEEMKRYSQLWEERQHDLTRLFMVGPTDLWPFIKQGMKNIITNHLPHCVAYTEMAKMLVKQFGVRVALCARLRRAVENAFFAVFRQAGVPTMMLLHGHISRRPERYFDDGYFADAGAICVWGEEQRRVLLETRAGIKPSQIHVTGNPAWDTLGGKAQSLGDRTALRREVAEALDVDPTSMWVTLTTQYGQPKCQFEAIQRAVLSVRGAVLLVKIHPGETVAFYRKHLLDRAGRRVRLVPHELPLDLFRLLKASDVMLTFSSTTNLEALLIGTPVITVAIDPALQQSDRLVYLERFGLPLARTEKELSDLLARYLCQADWRAELVAACDHAVQQFIANRAKGDATTQVVDVLSSMLHERT